MATDNHESRPMGRCSGVAEKACGGSAAEIAAANRIEDGRGAVWVRDRGVYMEAGLTDLGHYVKYQAISAYEFVAGVGDSEVTGIGLKPSGHVGVFEATARFGVDYIRGPEAFGEMSYRLGTCKGTGQLGYSNGGLRAIGRVERGGRNTAVGYTFGTAENLRAKLRFGPLSLQYNSDLSGRIDLKVGKAYGIALEVYGNTNLTPGSLEHFDQSRTYSDWSFRGMPYGGAAW